MNNTVTIYCQYFARAGGKKEYMYNKHINISEETIDKLSQYSGSFGIEGNCGGTPLTTAINTTWSDSLSESNQTKKSELTETENCIEYYDGVGLILKKMTYTYRINGKTIEQIETEIITTYPTATKYFSPTELRTEAIADMKNRFDIDTVEITYNLILPDIKKQNPFLEWKISHKGESRPINSIYSGTGCMNDGRCYIARFNNVPGKVNADVNVKTKIVTLCNFWSPGFWHHRHSGEVLTTNCKYEWKKISKGGKIPHNALGPYKINTREFYGGRIKYAWVAKSVSGEPGRLTCDTKYYNDIKNKEEYRNYDKETETTPKMYNIKAHASWFTEDNGYILVIKDYPEINGFSCLDTKVNDDYKS